MHIMPSFYKIKKKNNGPKNYFADPFNLFHLTASKGQVAQEVKWPPECADFTTTIEMLSLWVNQPKVSTMLEFCSVCLLDCKTAHWGFKLYSKGANFAEICLGLSDFSYKVCRHTVVNSE